MINLFNIEDYIVDTSKFTHVLHDKGVDEFERAFAEYVGVKYACSVNSATSAIFLLLLNQYITVSIPSCIPPVVLNSIVNSGNKINFTDDVDWIGNSYILHDFGDYKIVDSAQKVNRDQFKLECNPQDLLLFSFYPTKPVGGMDGGMIVSNDLDKISLLKETVLNGMGYAHNNWERSIKFPGWKMYLNSTQAYIAHGNLTKLDNKKQKLSQVRALYNEQLGYDNTSDHLYRIRVDDNKEFIKNMKSNEIVCGIHYDACHLNSIYNNRKVILCPNSEREAARTVSIPFHEKLGLEEIDYIVSCIKELT